MAALLERNIIQLCLNKRLMLTTTFVRGSRYSKQFVDCDLKQEDIKEDVEFWKGSGKPKQFVKAVETDQSTFGTYSDTVRFFQNMIMEHGKKSLARKLVNKTMEEMKRIQLRKYQEADAETKQKIELNPYKIFHEAVENGKPVLHTRQVFKSGIYYTVPEACPPQKQLYYCMKWLGEGGMDKGPKVRFYDQLAKEVISLYHKQGYTMRKKQELHRRCESNKAFAQLKWKR